jgi:hypothetical protein
MKCKYIDCGAEINVCAECEKEIADVEDAVCIGNGKHIHKFKRGHCKYK